MRLALHGDDNFRAVGGVLIGDVGVRTQALVSEIAAQRPRGDRLAAGWYLSSSISSDTIGANGSISVSSAFNATALAGMSYADRGEITRSPSSSRRTAPSLTRTTYAATRVPLFAAGDTALIGSNFFTASQLEEVVYPLRDAAATDWEEDDAP